MKASLHMENEFVLPIPLKQFSFPTQPFRLLHPDYFWEVNQMSFKGCESLVYETNELSVASF